LLSFKAIPTGQRSSEDLPTFLADQAGTPHSVHCLPTLRHPAPIGLHAGASGRNGAGARGASIRPYNARRQHEDLVSHSHARKAPDQSDDALLTRHDLFDDLPAEGADLPEQ